MGANRECFLLGCEREVHRLGASGLRAATQGTPERSKRRQVVVRVPERITNRRTNCTHQESRRLVNRFDVIAVEDLAVRRMVHHHGLAQSMHDAAWLQCVTPPPYIL